MKIVKDIFNEKLKDSKLVYDEEAEQAFTSIIKWLGEDPAREGLKSTPKRLVKAYKEYFKGYSEDPKKFLEKTFGDVQGYDDMVVQKNISVQSHCEHHMAPIIGVAHRLARDHRKNIIALSVLDICPTLDMYELTTKDFAKAYFHWFFLIQPKWLPERMIMSDPRKWMKSCLDKWSGNHKFGKVEENYLKCFKQPKRIHGSCEDYRASATIDLDHDKQDRKKKLNIPVQVLWGSKGVIGKQFKPIKIWQRYTKRKVIGYPINSGHFIPEQNPKATIKHLSEFFLRKIK